MKSLFLASLLIIPFMQGCGLEGFGGSSRVAEPQIYSLDGVKWITPEIRSGTDPRAMTQAGYSISESERLLMRFENLSAKASSISLGNGRNVQISITLETGENLSAALAALRVCPVTKNWMMEATWERAYPMGKRGGWSRDGGDFAESGCVAGSVSSAARTTAQSNPGASSTLSFDVTSWIVDEVRGRGVNYGLILISANGARVRIRGDQDASYSPRISWILAP